jgi:hypothetical protein
MIVGTCVAMMCATPALAGPKDQVKAPLVAPQAFAGNATVNNATTDFKFQQKGCKLQIKAKGLTGLADGDVIICIAGTDVIAPPTILPPGAGNAIILTGEAKAGGLKIKADLTEALCGTNAAVSFNTEMSCYLDDPLYRTPGGTWVTGCTNVGSVPIANPSADPDTLKVNDTQNVVVGLCQNFATLGARPDPPASSLIAVMGSALPLLP